ncbi:MAG: MarR family winged helix-turn-helix transcriptional regulator [Chloroflexota bacterium]
MSDAKDQGSADALARRELQERIVAGYEAMMARLMTAHRPEFLEIGVTMSQAKVLYLLEAARELHMAELVTMLGVSLSTVSGLVDRLVDQGLVERREDPADRRQVVVVPTAAAATLTDRFRELNQRQLLALLDHLSDDELIVVARAIEVLARAAAEVGTGSATVPAPDPAGGRAGENIADSERNRS